VFPGNRIRADDFSHLAMCSLRGITRRNRFGLGGAGALIGSYLVKLSKKEGFWTCKNGL
jgi:hypothetical protein